MKESRPEQSFKKGAPSLDMSLMKDGDNDEQDDEDDDEMGINTKFLLRSPVVVGQYATKLYFYFYFFLYLLVFFFAYFFFLRE